MTLLILGGMISDKAVTSHDTAEDDLEDYKTAFDLLDSNRDGEIDKIDLSDFIKLNIGEETTETELQEMISAVDVDGNGSINFNEFLKLMEYKDIDPDSAQDMHDAFQVFDVEGQGYISAEELKHVMTNIGESLTEEESQELIRLIDADGDGLVNYEELIKILCS